MTDLTRTARFAAALVVALGVAACGEDGKGIKDTDHCPEQSLYKYVFVDGGVGGGSGFWAVRKPDDTKFSPSELVDLNKALKEATQLGKVNPPPEPPTSTGPRCLTPFGTAVSLDGG